MSFLPVLAYLGGLAVFGFVYWIMDGIMTDFVALGIAETGDVYTLLIYFWMGIVVIYLLFGGWWLIRMYNESAYGFKPGGRI